MLPHYPNNPRHHHHHRINHQQDQPFLPNPTAAAAFLMPATATSWDGYGGQISSADIYSQETLEAVLRQPVTALRQDQAVRRKPREGAPVVDGGVRSAAAAAAARKRPFRTDRHSKIHTAQGVRDRRMRLSVGVARDFFALQDRLGFDKASKTVNWLLTQSKPAIDRLRDAAVPAAASEPAAVKEKGEGSSLSTGCFKDSREKVTEKGRNRCGHDGPAALMEEHGGGELDWILLEAAAAEPPLPLDGLEYYYQY